MDQIISLKSTSKYTAIADDIVLRQKDTTRLIFRPMIVNNPKNPGECVKGHFIYQRISKNDEWEDTKSINLSNLKSGEGINLEVKSKELFTLIKNLAPLYKIHKAYGVLFGEHEILLSSKNVISVLKQVMNNSENLQILVDNYGEKLLTENFKWLNQNSNRPEVIKKIMDMDVSSFEELDRLIGLARINKALEIWQQESNNADEEFWQDCFSSSPWILCHATSYPVIFLKGKAYVGGKSIENKNGNILDFLYKNKLTENSVLIEIKTPITKLLGQKYRNNSYSISDELSGGINQLLSYRDSLMKESANLLKTSHKELRVYYPKCILVIGHFEREINDEVKRFSFESFRGELKNIEVITYDELFSRIENITNIMEDRMIL